ncbi:hypothetical protein CEXT_532971 [Caerostris extrusa]|uniref:Uncharacterized protein n=1 Tax=Caerostris extrusa TaxID=172846 RepID=A0AAV4PK16_CAEEX|nr:hypothetical protein CEXT_532971 [Caerostris extrusa]
MHGFQKAFFKYGSPDPRSPRYLRIPCFEELKRIPVLLNAVNSKLSTRDNLHCTHILKDNIHIGLTFRHMHPLPRTQRIDFLAYEFMMPITDARKETNIAGCKYFEPFLCRHTWKDSCLNECKHMKKDSFPEGKWKKFTERFNLFSTAFLNVGKYSYKSYEKKLAELPTDANEKVFIDSSEFNKIFVVPSMSVKAGNSAQSRRCLQSRFHYLNFYSSCSAHLLNIANVGMKRISPPQRCGKITFLKCLRVCLVCGEGRD